MKKIILLNVCLLCALWSNAEGSESVCVLSNSVPQGYVCSPSSLGPVSPCTTIPFIVRELFPPQGYVIVGKFEWYVNNILVKTTTDPSDFGLNWPIASRPTTVYCKVPYKKQDGTLSTPYN